MYMGEFYFTLTVEVERVVLACTEHTACIYI